MYDCAKCSFQSRHFYKLTSHYRFLHSHEHDFSISCTVDKCERTYKNLDSFLKHVKRKHKNFHDIHLSKYKENSRDESILESLVQHNIEYEDDIEDNHMQENNDSLAEEKSVNFHKKLGAFLLMLREKYKLPSVVIPVIVNEFISMICHHQAQLSQSFNDTMRDHVGEIEMNEIKSILEQQTDVEDALGSLDTEFKLNKFAKQFLNFVQPIEFKADRNSSNTYQYVPILETLKSLLAHDDVFSYVINGHKSNDGILRDFCDGELYNSNPLFRNDHKALQIILFFDEFTAVNPLGHQIKNYKIGGFYMLLGNLPPKFRSRLYVIQLVLLCLSSCIKKNGFQTILEPLINDLQTLERDGIIVNKADGQHQLFGTVSVVVADNLGAHGLGGFLESFTTVRNCRYCFVTRENMQKVFDSNSFNMRTVEMYSEQVRLVESNPNLSSVYGLKRNCPLNSLDFYHVVTGMPPDVAHDLFEGVVSEVMTNVIKECVVAGYFSLNDLNDKISSFPYADVDKSNKPSKVGEVLRNFKVRQSAAQMWCFVRLLPLLVGDKVPMNELTWECLLLLRDLLFYVCAPALEKGHILSMQDIIEEFHLVYRRNFPVESVKPKFHYTLHYPQLTLLFGPLIHLQTLRFEGKHNYFKELVYRTKNRKNICKSLAERHQYYQCTFNVSDKFLSDNEGKLESTGGSMVSICLLNEDIKQQLKGIIQGEEVFTCKSLTVFGITYWKNSCIVTGLIGFNMQFSKIQDCAIVNGKPYLICRKLRTVDFERHFHSFVVIETNQFELCSIADLIDPNPLGIYTHPSFPHLKLIVVKHKIVKG